MLLAALELTPSAVFSHNPMDYLSPSLRGSAASSESKLRDRILGIGYLESQRVSDRTFRTYRSVSLSFLDWLSNQSYEFYTLGELDLALSFYIAILYDDNPRWGNRQHAVNIYSGLGFFVPEFARGFCNARAAVKCWDRLVPAVPPLPIPQNLLFGFCGHLLSVNRPVATLALNLAFDSYMRAMDLLSLTAVNLLYSEDARLPPVVLTERFGGCLVEREKTGTNQFIPLSDLVTLSGLELHAQFSGLSSVERLFDFSYAQFSSVLLDCVRFFGLSEYRYTLHSLRHGGATHDYFRGVPFDFIMEKGRWSHPKSCRRNSQASKGLLAAASYSAATKRLIHRYPRMFERARSRWGGVQAGFS